MEEQEIREGFETHFGELPDSRIERSNVYPFDGDFIFHYKNKNPP